MVCRILTFVMSHAATADATMPQDWCPLLVVESLAMLQPVLEETDVLSNDSLLLSHLRLLFQLLELHPQTFFPRVTPTSVQITCKAVSPKTSVLFILG